MMNIHREFFRLFLLIVVCLVCGVANAQTITKEFRAQPLKQVFSEIERQTGLSVNYKIEDVNENQKVTKTFRNTPVVKVLSEILDPSLDVTLQNKMILISKKQFKQVGKISNKKVTGRIVDEKGEPIIGASVQVKGTSNGTMTDMNGSFTLNNVPSNATIAVSYVGYHKYEAQLKDKTTLKIALQEDTKLLDEVVVVGYGTQSKARVTGSITSLKSDKIKDMPVTSFEQAIAGQMPGVQVMEQSGTPEGGSSIKVRGASSITAGTNPLIVIDGYPMITNNTSSILNMDDIESIEVLKDASSAAIYGSRGANGVIIITTKQGKEGKAKITAKAYFGIKTVTKKLDLLNAYEWTELAQEARNNYWVDLKPGVNKATDPNSVRNVKKARIPDEWLPYLNKEPGLVDTDWQDVIFQSAKIQQYDIAISGGAKNISHYTSASYLSQDGIIVGSNFQRLSVRSNIRTKINDRVNLDLSLAPSYSKTSRISQSDHKNDGVTLLSQIANPLARAFNDDGSIMYGDQITKGTDWGFAVIENPLAIAKDITDDIKRFRMLGNANLSIKIMDGLDFKSSLGVEYSNARENYFRPSYLGDYNVKAPTLAEGKYWNSETLDWVNENTLSYKKDFGKHHVEALLGISAEKQKYFVASMQAANFPNNDITTLNAGVVNAGSTSETLWTLLSYFGRINYFYNNKYLLNLSLRRDGSSRFGKNNKYGYFPAVSLGWRVKDEEWLKDVKEISDLKLRLSYGKTGNFQIDNFGSYSLLESSNYVLNGSLVAGLSPSTSPNPDVSWEKTTQWNVGLDMSFFNNQLSFSADYYHSITDGMLLDVPLPASSGFTKSLQNIGKMQNIGFELSLKGDFDFNGFKWNSAANFSLNRNKVLALGPGQTQIISGNHITMVGKPMANYYGYNILGVFKSQEELDKYPHLSSAKIGTYIYEDISGPNGVPDGQITDVDRKITGNYLPNYTIGFNNSFSYKNFDLSFMIQCVVGNEMFNRSKVFLLNTESWGNALRDLYTDHYSEANPNARYARPNSSTANKQWEQSNYIVEDASFVRLNNITIGYNFPKKIIQSWGISGLRLYATAQNPITITKYSGYNPEAETGSNALTPGIDYGGYATGKSVAFGINVNF